MSPRKAGATGLRVLRQLRHDPRTIGLILLIPTVLMVVMRYVFNDDTTTFKAFAPIILGIFPFIVMFIVTSITMLRERTTGTLERLMTLPIAKLELLSGYALAFGLLAVCQAALASFVTLHWLDTSISGSVGLIILVALLSGLLGMSLGLFMSDFATSEFQAVQFMPALVFPQLLTSGLFVARDQMAKLLQWFADIMPLTYVVDAMKRVTTDANWTAGLARDIWVIVGFALAALVLSAATLRRNH
ncbi:MAG TPA: ABC transporter permease [Candidatus Saccharimonadales bacterium]|nr:ABC transporter permease [Candidatus Saccharimonadales bacterium]